MLSFSAFLNVLCLAAVELPFAWFDCIFRALDFAFEHCVGFILRPLRTSVLQRNVLYESQQACHLLSYFNGIGVRP